MRRQFSLAEAAAPVQEGSTHRLDPFCLPARSLITVSQRSRLECGGELYLDRTRVILKGRLKSGFPLTLSIPVSSFRHVALRWETEDGSQEPVITLWLVHRDPSLSLRLDSFTDAEDAALAVKAWAGILSLPALHYGEDGRETIVEDRLGPLVVKPQQPRRRHAHFAARRPRFLVRRKIGLPGHFPVYNEREIVART
ncbi:DUF6101 family protein [Coralliovum pocilloporae]|uniref:DUF6101 family protein n=1 Tax=Coralliovum pocilloporae TaxID=3066369 RepID=UPI00330793F2